MIFDDSTRRARRHDGSQGADALPKYLPESTKIITPSAYPTARSADRILVLDNGNAVGEGTHEELIRTM
jgi:ABC-type multidrug transport system fused ATPase/permease subunit